MTLYNFFCFDKMRTFMKLKILRYFIKQVYLILKFLSLSSKIMFFKLFLLSTAFVVAVHGQGSLDDLISGVFTPPPSTESKSGIENEVRVRTF